MDERLEANRANWDDRVAIHTMSKFYDVEGWLRDAPGPPAREVELLGDVTGKSLVQLQCHFGMETLQWARAGARVTGVDFSPAAIDAANDLAQRTGLSARATFVCANVYDAPAAVAGQQFDIVYVTIGALFWLPDIRAWGKVVADLLAPGGQFYIFEVHPFSMSFDHEGEHVVYDFVNDPESPIVIDDGSTYTDGGEIAHPRTYEWNHSLSEIIQSLIDEGLVITTFIEHDWTVFQAFPWLEKGTDGIYRIPNGRPRQPLCFTLHARR
jgi:SAM-dependent methyltransferase